MSPEVKTLSPGMSMMEAARFLEDVSHTGAPVVGEDGLMVGVLTLRDIQRGRKAGQMHVPVRNFMSKKVDSALPSATVREIDDLFYERNIGHLPVVEEGRLVGIVTRTDILEFKKRDRERRDSLLKALGGAVTAETRASWSSSESCE